MGRVYHTIPAKSAESLQGNSNPLQPSFKLLVAAGAKHSPRCFRHGVGSLMEVAMRKVIRIATAALAVTALSLIAAIPLVAAWRMSAEQQATDMPGPFAGLLTR